MIHVPDVRAMIDRYNSLGFKRRDHGREDGGEIVSRGPGLRKWIGTFSSRMLTFCAKALRAGWNSWKTLDTFHGMREFILGDINRFWITFGEPLRN